MQIPYLGEILALLTAMVWALAVILFKRSGETVHPLGLNLFKNSLAFALMIPTLWIAGQTLFHEAPAEDYLLLLASGALGIGVSDTLFFMSLNRLGAALSAIVDCLYSPFVILLSMIWLGEKLTLWQWIGAAMIVGAVLEVAVGKAHKQVSRQDILWGIIWGTLALLGMAIGIVMIKPLLDRSPLLWVTEVRLGGGILVLMGVLLFNRRRQAILQTIRSSQGWRFTLSGSFAGAYVAMILWLAGMKHTQASIAAALNQTSNIFVFVLAALLLGEAVTKGRVIALGMGVLGAVLVTVG